jgi:hypothetical protein
MVIPMLAATVSAQEVSYDNFNKLICEGSQCTLNAYAAVHFVEEDNQWKTVQEARTLHDKGVYDVNTLSDNIHGLDIVEFNYSCITILPYDADESEFKYNSNIPIKIDGITVAMIRIPSPAFIPISRSFCFQDTVLIHNYEFGKSSTIVNITGNTTNSGYVRDANCGDSGSAAIPGNLIYGGTKSLGQGREYQSFWQFDTNSVPDTVTRAVLHFEIAGANGLQAGQTVALYNCTYGTLGIEDWNIATGTDYGTIFDDSHVENVNYTINLEAGTIVAGGKTQLCNTNDFACVDANNDIAVFLNVDGTFLEVEYTVAAGPCWGEETGLLYASSGCVVYDEEGDGLLDVFA